MNAEKLEGLTVVLPAFNEEANVGNVLEECLEYLPSVCRAFELIVVNDGSRDRTEEVVLEKARISKHRIHCVSHPTNRGYGAALRSGFAAATQPWTLFMDSDGQFDIRELRKLIPYTSMDQIVAGFRMQRKDPWQRILAGAVFTAVNRLAFRIPLRDLNCAFKLIKTDVIRSVSLETDGACINAELIGKLLRQGARLIEIGVEHRPRLSGTQTGLQFWVIRRAIKEWWMLFQVLRRPPPWRA